MLRNKLISNNDMIIPGDLFLVTYSNLKYFFNYIESQLGVYVKNISEPLYKWFSGIYGTFPTLLLKSLINLPFSAFKDYISEKLFNITGTNYAFQFLYLGHGWIMVQEKTGVHIYRLTLEQLKNFDIWRYNNKSTGVSLPQNPNDIIKQIFDFWNLKYDNWKEMNSIFDNIQKFLVDNNLMSEKIFNSLMGVFNTILSNPSSNFQDEYIGNVQLIVRVYESMGITISSKPSNQSNIESIIDRFYKVI